MTSLFRAALLTLLAVFATACASAGTSGESDTTADPVYVNVDNSARSDVDVSVRAGGQNLRLGRVQIGEDRGLRVPDTFLRSAPYSFAVEVVARDGTGSYTTPSLVLNQGQDVYIEVSPTLSASRYTVR